MKTYLRGFFVLVFTFLIVAAVLTVQSFRNVGVPKSSLKMAEIKDVIRVDSPKIGENVASPLVIKGYARGTWFFEGSFPVRLLDGSGKEIAHTQGTTANWMTAEFTPFRATLHFKKPSMPFGTLVLEKDNPSGLSQNAQEIRIPVFFR